MIKFAVLFILIVLLLIMSMTWGSTNDQEVIFNYLVAQAHVKLSTLSAILFGSGFILGWLLTGIFFLRLKLRLKAAQRKLNKLQKKYGEEVVNHQKK